MIKTHVKIYIKSYAFQYFVFWAPLINQTVNVLRGVKMFKMNIRILRNHTSNANRALEKRSNWLLLKWKPKMNAVEQIAMKHEEGD